MYCVDDVVYVEDDDQCIACDNYARGVACPLIEALASGFVFMEDSMIVKNCGFYKEFKRNLRLVKGDEK